MSIQSIAALLFILCTLLFILYNRKKVEVQKILFPLIYFVMYRTSLGLSAMDRIAARFPRTLKLIAKIAIILGFIGMALISFELVYSSFKLIKTPEAMPSIKPVLPFEAKGVFLYLLFI